MSTVTRPAGTFLLKCHATGLTEPVLIAFTDTSTQISALLTQILLIHSHNTEKEPAGSNPEMYHFNLIQNKYYHGNASPLSGSCPKVLVRKQTSKNDREKNKKIKTNENDRDPSHTASSMH